MRTIDYFDMLLGGGSRRPFVAVPGECQCVTSALGAPRDAKPAVSKK